jgi:hypothetical protein
MDNVTPLRPKDRTNAERQRRYRRRRTVTPESVPTVTVTTVEMAALAGRLGVGRVTVEDLKLAERLILRFMQALPTNGKIDLLP